MRCRRCYSSNLLALEKRAPGDNLVLRCRDCGFLFSPPDQGAAARARVKWPGMPDTLTDEKLMPLPFANDVLRVQLWSKQKEVLTALPSRRRVAVKSGNGLGKGYCAAVAVLSFLYYHDPAIVLSTAPTFRQVRHVLWRQVHRLYRGSADVLGG